LLAAACASDASVGPTLSGPSRVLLTSDAGDYIGAGRTYEYTKTTAIIGVTAVGGHLTISVAGDEGWHADFVMPQASARVQKGTYGNLARFPFHDPAAGGFDWSGEGRGCNTSASTVVVEDVAYEDAAVVSLDLRFEQRCDGSSSALRGTIHWKEAEETVAPGPVVPIPGTLWTPTPGSVPASGNFVYWEVPASAPVGAKFPYLMTPEYNTINVSSTGGFITVGVSGAASFRLEFEAMTGVNQLKVGYYPGLQRYPFHNTLKGGLDIAHDGYGCNTLTGWVAIDRVDYTNGRLAAIEMRFERTCDGGAPGNGKVHWTG
jgi:hypothetical protein